ncbi:MAG: DNA double-strand break repair nuclease NurA, partial [Leptolyngbya sp.]|nr:DNA double-strand break repair nuclease NurA [Leptolyngbya sp.]
MPVSPSQILAALDSKRQDFSRFNLNIQQDLQRYRQVWRQLTQGAADAVAADLPPGRVGGRPLEPFTAVKRGVLPFKQKWESREASLAWVRTQLTGVTTFAVDGSQIFPSKDVSLPVALVQIGWFENPHTADGVYHKDIQLDVLTPTDLKTERMAEPVDRQVNIRRFQMEVQRLVDYMAACQQPDRTLVFFDGSLVVTFADAFDPESQRAYVEAMVSLLAASDRYRVPLVGYVDTSYARDLTSLLPHWSSALAPVDALHDAQMLSPLMQWGDRTPLFVCDREGI